MFVVEEGSAWSGLNRSLLSQQAEEGSNVVIYCCENRDRSNEILEGRKKIMDEGFPNFTYRILGYLLLGVVRIFSHKVEYVLLDCNQMLLKAKQTVAAKRNEAQASSFLAPHQSITLPESLELDKFIFEDIGVEKRYKLMYHPYYDLLGVCYRYFTNPDNNLFCICGEGLSIDLETFLDSGTPNQDILSPQPVNISLDDTLMYGMDNIERSIETLIQKFGSPLEACEAEMVNLPGHLPSCPAVSSVNNDENEAQNMEQAETSESQRHKKLFVTVDRSPERNLTDPSDGGAGAQSFKAMPTPVNKENVPVKRKRKCLIDEQVVLSNKMVKESIDYSGDLVRKRVRVPDMALGVWKHGLMLDLKNNLTHPLIPCAFLGSKNCHCDDILMSTESLPNLGASEVLGIPVSRDEKNTDSDKEKMDGPEASDVEKVGENINIAPETPHKDATLECFPVAETFGRVREARSSNSTEELTIEQHEQLPTEVYNSSELDFQEPDGWSSSTRQAVQDLRSAFSGKNEHQEKEQVNLHEALKGKSKSISAKMFYDILVLKSRGMVNVQQDKPYGDILVTKSARWVGHNRE
ncbi:hypothetical protein QQ045_011156 [Rhodiola kirilowii]